MGKWHRSHYRQEDHANRAKLATQLDAISDLALRKFHAQECPDPKLLAQVRANLAEIRGIWGL
ncbi:MAG: hypothetical protein O3A00_02330 [Planctomycetota bacterium]|nr:hypothetical protein [Planctomycetota bacterium]